MDQSDDKDETTNKTSELSTNANAFSIDAIISQHKTPATNTKKQSNVVNKDIASAKTIDPIKLQSLDAKNPFNIRSPKVACSVSTQLPESVNPAFPGLADLKCNLESKDLWRKFHDLGTEMIITKTGRRMFPTVRVSFSNVELDGKYLVVMDIVPVDYKRYRYAYHKSCWLVAGKADPPLQARIYFHPESPLNGVQLSKQMCSFEKLKLTNNTVDLSGHVILHSMHKYQPRIHVIAIDSSTTTLETIPQDQYKTFVFPETQFTAVTAYQNQLITRLKIDSNPFAKGFRDSSRISEYEQDSVESLLSDRRMFQPNLSALEVLLAQNNTKNKSEASGSGNKPTLTPSVRPRIFPFPDPYSLSYHYSLLASELKGSRSPEKNNSEFPHIPSAVGAEVSSSFSSSHENSFWKRQRSINSAALRLATSGGRNSTQQTFAANNLYSRYYPYLMRSAASRQLPIDYRMYSAIAREAIFKADRLKPPGNQLHVNSCSKNI